MTPNPDYRLFDLAGDAYSVGQALGSANAPFSVPAWWPPPPDLAFARACEAQIAEIAPWIPVELQGYAEAQQMEYTELLRGVCRRSMRMRIPSMPAYPEGGCSAFALVAEDGHVLAGRNYDFHPAQRVRQRIRLSPSSGGLPTVGARGSAVAGRYDGVNARGLFVSLHVVMCDQPSEPEAGVPFHLLPRLVLETCTSVSQAVDLLLRVRHLHAFNYLLADASGDMAVVEAHPQRVRMLEPLAGPGGRPYLSAANHYCHPEMAGFQRGRRLDHSQGRWQRLSSLAREGNIAKMEDLPRALADHASRVCGHQGGHTTLWSAAADLSARRLAYASGPACSAAFEPVPWPENC